MISSAVSLSSSRFKAMAPPNAASRSAMWRLVVGLCERLRLGNATGIVVLHDDGARGVAEVAQDRQGIVDVGDVDLAGVLAGLEELDVGGQVPARLTRS